MTFAKLEYPSAVIQTSTQTSYVDYYKGRFTRLVEGVVLRTYYVDEQRNFSAQWSHNQGVEGQGESLVASNVDGSLSPLFKRPTGYRIECDVLLTMTSHRGSNFAEIYRVPVMQRGGIADQDIWVPKSSTTYKMDRDLNPEKLDGDVVLIQCVGGVFPKGAIIIGMSPHRWNFRDGPRSVNGSRELSKEIGDGLRKDGRIRLSRYNGAVCPLVDRHGNILFDTTESNRRDKLDVETGRHTVTQDNTAWTAGATETDITEVATPGGGDVTFRVKNTRRFRIEFNDNQQVERDYTRVNPPEYKETGYIQIHQNDAGTRVLEVAASDDLIINIRKNDTGNGSITINTIGNVDVNSGGEVNVQAAEEVTINSDVTTNGITLGDALLDNFVTKDFITDVFMLHSHTTAAGVGTPPGYVAPTVPPTTVQYVVPINGQMVTSSAGTVAKVNTTKVQGE